jgi:3'-5' exoribonuclease 1
VLSVRIGDERSRRAKQRQRGRAKGEQAAEVDVVRSPLVAPDAAAASSRPPPFPYLCVCDVEATCEEFSKGYEHEIIEFPVVVLDLADGSTLGEFHSYVRPTRNTTLSEFCKRLTGIRQEQVDAAPTLPEVLAAFDEWRLAAGLVHTEERRDFAFGADGPWDLRFFLHGECTRKRIPKAAYYEKWVNIKQLFADFYRVRPCKIHRMLELQGLRFEGRLHSGIDDTRNIARIAARMREEGCVVHINEALPPRERVGGPLSVVPVPRPPAES